MGETKSPNFVIVLGTTYSGASAVYEYLRSRGDLRDPLPRTEFLLPQAPNGLMSLEAAAGQFFHVGKADHALWAFERLAQSLARPGGPLKYGHNYTSFVPDFLTAVHLFCKSITAASLPMKLDWQASDAANLSLKIENLRKSLRGRPRGPSRVLKGPQTVVRAAQQMHNRMFSVAETSEPVLLDQAGAGWNPVNSTKYFGRRKVVLVERDPRDQYASLKLRKGAWGVYEFIKWRRELDRRLSVVDSPLLWRVSFEQFVGHPREGTIALDNFLGLENQSSLEPQIRASASNIGKFRKVLTSEEISAIEKKLMV